MQKLFYAAAFTAAVMTARALDNTIHNSFWDTRNYVNPTPSVMQSTSSATASFDLSGRSWRIAEQLRNEFKSNRFVGCALYFR